MLQGLNSERFLSEGDLHWYWNPGGQIKSAHFSAQMQPFSSQMWRLEFKSYQFLVIVFDPPRGGSRITSDLESE